LVFPNELVLACCFSWALFQPPVFSMAGDWLITDNLGIIGASQVCTIYSVITVPCTSFQ